jgi:hypothetical protein
MRTYQHSGIVPLVGAVQALAIGCASAVVLGVVYAFTFYYIPYVYLNFLLAIGFGAAVGWIVGWGAREGNIRNTPVTVGIAVVASLLGLYAEWGASLYAMCPSDELSALWGQAGLAPFLPHHIVALMFDLFENGSWSLAGEGMFIGWPLVALWAVEVATIVGMATTTAHGQVALRPFCEACQAWITGEAPHLYVGDGSESVWTEVQTGSFDTLADTPRATGGEPTYVRLTLHVCASCEGSNYLTITRCENTTDHRGNPKTVETSLTTNLTIDATQAELIRTANLIAPTVEAAALAEAAVEREWTVCK